MTSKLAVVALLLVAGCNSGTRGSPDGGGGTGGSGGAGGSGNPGACTGTLNGSCNNNNDIECFEYAGVPAATLSPIIATCEEDSIGTWNAGSACTRTGAVGGCRMVAGPLCEVFWTYEGTTAFAMSECAERGGEWVSP